MILVLDIGNTNIKFGVYQNDQLIYEFIKETKLDWSMDEYHQFIKLSLLDKNISPNDFIGAIISSVVDKLTMIVKKAIDSLLKVDAILVNKDLKMDMLIKIDNPSELGTDLICDCVGAISKYSSPLIVIDLGTASKILVVNKEKEFIGCTISVGLTIGLKALINNTSKLNNIDLKRPSHVIGKNTTDSLNSGAIYATECMIDGMCKKIEKEINSKCIKVLTGGNAKYLYEITSKEFIFEPFLSLQGLYHLYKKNKSHK